MALNIPPAPGPGEAPVFEKRMGELRDQLEQKRAPRQRRRERGPANEASSAAAAAEAGEAPAASSAPPPKVETTQPAAEAARSAAVPVQPESWEEPYVRPPRKRPKRRRPEPEPLRVPLGGMRLVGLCALVSALVSAGMCLALGAGDASAAGALLTTAGWSL